MKIPVLAVAVVGFALVDALLFAALVGLVTVMLAQSDGTSLPSALARGGVAFGSALTLALALLTFVGIWLL